MSGTSAVDPASDDYLAPRQSLRKPIAELFQAAAALDIGVGAHLGGDRLRAAASFRAADMQVVRHYVESMWGKRSLWPDQPHYLRFRKVLDLPPRTPESRGLTVSPATKRAVVNRDGFLCRYCELPLVPASVRKALSRDYPAEVPWGSTNVSQHSAFQALWLQFDHVVPLTRSGTNDVDNVVASCGPCNFMKWDYHLEELGVIDPRSRTPVTSCWDGLTRLLGGVERCVL